VLIGPNRGNPAAKKLLRGEEDIGNPDEHGSAMLLFCFINLDRDKNILP
jgi:hypothetical protein